MFRLFVILSLVAVGLGQRLPPDMNILNPFTPTGRIIGGESVTIEEVPHQVSLQIYGFGFCGGTIIAKEWVLTAAHCAVYSAQSVTVRAGTHRMGSGGSLHSVTRFIKHENYQTTPYGIPVNDVALIQLAEPFEIDVTRKPIELFEMDEESVAGTASIITGWGAIREGGSTSEILQRVSVPMVSKVVCDNAYKSFGGLPAGQICAAHPQGGKDACQGDSGGPLTIGGRLAGITSWGNGCARPGYPGVYTEVAAFRDWIEAKIGMLA